MPTGNVQRKQDETDEYIFKMTGGGGGGPRDESVDRFRPVQDPMKRTSDCNCDSCSLMVFTFLNVILVLIGIAAIAGGIDVKTKSDWNHVFSSDHTAYGLISIGVFLIIVASTGIAASRATTGCGKCFGSFYLLVLVLFMLLGFASIGVVAALKDHKLDGHLGHAWESALNDSSSDICKLQGDLKCSGWDEVCVSFNTTVPQCPNGCDTNTYNITCKEKIHNDVNDNFAELMIGTVAFSLAALFCVLLGCRHICGNTERRRGYAPVSSSPLYA